MMASVHFLAFSFGEAEIVAVVFLVIMALGSNRRSDFLRGLRRAISEFRKCSRDVAKEFDQAGFDAGRNLGGIHGKAAAEALTTENQTVELYDPAVLCKSAQNDHNRVSAKQK